MKIFAEGVCQNPYNLNFMKNIKVNKVGNVYRQRDFRSKYRVEEIIPTIDFKYLHFVFSFL